MLSSMIWMNKSIFMLHLPNKVSRYKNLLFEPIAWVILFYLDCLDRTNVVQSVIAKQKLYQQLQQMGITKHGESDYVLDNIFQNGI